MAKGYLIALVKMTNPDNFMTNYGAVVADVFAKCDGRFLYSTFSLLAADRKRKTSGFKTNR